MKRRQRPVLLWAKDDLLRYFKQNGAGTGWHFGRVVRMNAKETTIRVLKNHSLVTLPHSEFQRVEP